ncbi:MAG TPA: hypothetical protein VM325_19455 [Alphaproteobacteria bacterium]|nr:hypothetical protein [Alphaproteobacteria bacterium]
MLSEPQIRQSMAAQILDWVRKCLAAIQLTAPRAAGSKEPRARSGGNPAQAQCPLANNEAIRGLLAKLRAAEIDAAAGMIQMVQLGDVREAFGEQWAKMAETAMSIAEMLLRDRLEQSDVFARYLDYGFVVVFTRLDLEMAEPRAEALSQEISNLLLKKPELKEAFGAQQVTGPVSELIGANDSAPLETMTRELEARSQSKARQNGAIPVSGRTTPAPGADAKSTAAGPAKPPQDSEKPPPPQKKTVTTATPPTQPAQKNPPPRRRRQPRRRPRRSHLGRRWSAGTSPCCWSPKSSLGSASVCLCAAAMTANG